MGTSAVQFLCQFRVPISHSYLADDNCTSSRARGWRCFTGGRSGGSRWDWEKNSTSDRRSRFSEAYVTEEYDEEEDGFAFRKAKQRVWWSDDLYVDDDEDDEGFGIGNHEASIGFSLVSKVLRAFGWMIPAVVISLVMGTGPNGIIMAIALPLAQSALSFAADTLWGRADESPRRRPKSKKRPSGGGANRARVRKEKEMRSQMRNEARNSKSWSEGKKVNGSKQDFGGWDELDYHLRMEEEAHSRSVDEANEARGQERVKISRRTKGGTPLFTRFLIAMFPFLGFWTKFF